MQLFFDWFVEFPWPMILLVLFAWTMMFWSLKQVFTK